MKISFRRSKPAAKSKTIKKNTRVTYRIKNGATNINDARKARKLSHA